MPEFSETTMTKKQLLQLLNDEFAAYNPASGVQSPAWYDPNKGGPNQSPYTIEKDKRVNLLLTSSPLKGEVAIKWYEIVAARVVTAALNEPTWIPDWNAVDMVLEASGYSKESMLEYAKKHYKTEQMQYVSYPALAPIWAIMHRTLAESIIELSKGKRWNPQGVKEKQIHRCPARARLMRVVKALVCCELVHVPQVDTVEQEEELVNALREYELKDIPEDFGIPFDDLVKTVVTLFLKRVTTCLYARHMVSQFNDHCNKLLEKTSSPLNTTPFSLRLPKNLINTTYPTKLKEELDRGGSGLATAFSEVDLLSEKTPVFRNCTIEGRAIAKRLLDEYDNIADEESHLVIANASELGGSALISFILGDETALMAYGFSVFDALVNFLPTPSFGTDFSLHSAMNAAEGEDAEDDESDDVVEGKGNDGDDDEDDEDDAECLEVPLLKNYAEHQAPFVIFSEKEDSFFTATVSRLIHIGKVVAKSSGESIALDGNLQVPLTSIQNYEDHGLSHDESVSLATLQTYLYQTGDCGVSAYNNVINCFSSLPYTEAPDAADDTSQQDVATADIKTTADTIIAELKGNLASAQKEATNAKSAAMAARKEAKYLRHEVADLQREIEALNASIQEKEDEIDKYEEYVTLTEALQSDEEEEPIVEEQRVSFDNPYYTDKKIVIFGGFDRFQNDIQRLIPNARVIPDTGRNDLEPFRTADIVFMQINCMSHHSYWNVTNAAKLNGAQVYHLNHASPTRCANEIADRMAVAFGLKS